MSARFENQATPDFVGGWSDFRLPFEPKGESRVFRDQLRAAIRGLERRPVIHAEYMSADGSRCDVENITLYNVGAGAFAGLGNTALVVERRQEPSPRAPSGTAHAHFVGYRVFETLEPWRAWRPQETLLRMRSAPITRPITASAVWAALRQGPVGIASPWDRRRPLGVRIHVSSARPVRLVTHVKALLDGGIAAAHVHDGTDLAEVAGRLARVVREPPEHVLAWLGDARSAVLGPRRLVHRRADGVQWNPEDDAVVAIEVTTGTATETTVTMEIVAVARVPSEQA